MRINDLMYNLEMLTKVDSSDNVYAFVCTKEDAEGLIDPWMEQGGYALSEAQWVEIIEQIKTKCYSLILDLVADVVIDYARGDSDED